VNPQLLLLYVFKMQKQREKVVNVGEDNSKNIDQWVGEPSGVGGRSLLKWSNRCKTVQTTISKRNIKLDLLLFYTNILRAIKYLHLMFHQLTSQIYDPHWIIMHLHFGINLKEFKTQIIARLNFNFLKVRWKSSWHIYSGQQKKTVFNDSYNKEKQDLTRTQALHRGIRRQRNCKIHAQTRRGLAYKRSSILGSKNGHDVTSLILPTFITEIISSLVSSWIYYHHRHYYYYHYHY